MTTGALRAPASLEKAFAVVVLFLSTSALIQLLLYPEGVEAGGYDPAEGNPVSQVMWIGIYGITFLLILARRKQFILTATKARLLLFLVAIALLSVLWSTAPEVTVRRDIALVGTTMIGLYLATRYSLNELLRLLAWAMGLAALLSLAFGLALPSYGIDNHSMGGDWQGIYGGGKNDLGRNMALSALVFLLLAFSARRYRWAAWAGLGLSVGVLLLSNSVTSMATLLIVAVLLIPYGAVRWRYTLAVPCFIMVLLAGGLAALWLGGNLESVLSSLGRDTTFTNRTEVWPVVIEMIQQRPWLGYGYGGFWVGWEGESAQVFHWTTHEFVHSHNGFLELWLNLGLLGLSTFVLGFLLAIRRAVSWARATKTAEGLWPLAFLTFTFLYNLTEVSILVRNNTFWILYVVVALSTVVRPSSAVTAKWTASKYRLAP